MKFTGITRNPLEAQALREALHEHDLQVDLQIIVDVMGENPWLQKVVLKQELGATLIDLFDAEGLVDHGRANDTACAILNRGFKGYSLLKELVVERTEGYSYAVKDYEKWPDKRRAKIEARAVKA